MQLQSVKETAERFKISERRVQKLCEEGRIDGAQMISNVWVIPSTSLKPVDERLIAGDSDLVSLSDLCKELSISVATGRNWLKLEKITPSSIIKSSAFFSREYVAELKGNIKSGRNSSLKSRRNKKYISGNNVYQSYVSGTSKNIHTVQQIISFIEENNIELTKDVLCAIVAECAVQLILEKNNYDTFSNSLLKYIQKDLPASGFWFLIDDLIADSPGVKNIIQLYPKLFDHQFVYEQSEDILGLLYISLNNIGCRKATGSYYTPTKIVQRLCGKLFDMNTPIGKDVFDPCCGTGNFILQLPPEIGFDNVYGNDIDTMSVYIARLNYALKYDVRDADTVYAHITEKDYLSFSENRKFDYIIGNPPWGYSFNDSQKTQLREKYVSATSNNIESYDVFVEQALSNLKEGGLLSYVLPEAILNVKTHTPIRKVLLNHSSFQYIEFLGNAFDKVQCPCIILQTAFTNAGFSSVGLRISDASREYTIHTSRKIDAECISFSMTDEEYQVMEKIESLNNKMTLYGNARFALGIVTGNNKEYITQIKTSSNEMILKGSDLCKFRYKPSSNYIAFKPESFQQIAPTEYYRAPEKLLYRFICNQLVFSYDNAQTLSLNSCNILIPEIPDLSIKYIMAVLNSRIAQFYFKKKFNSVKVLRSHIEQIPIPGIEKAAQDEIVSAVDSILESADSLLIHELYDELDEKIADFYNLSVEDYHIIKSSMAGENLFL
ncbi:MAG: N-6 DNA methylase [Blautia sp.]|nr:N-6 DNA methylase [Blautia sp.]